MSSRNTQIFYACSLTSWTGLWMQKVATDWLAWQLTHSALWIGILTFCNLGPSVIVSPFAGAVSDRVDRLRLTVLTQLITAGHALTLAVLTLTGLIRIEYMAALEILLGTSQAFAQPARQSLVPGMVSRADLPGAVALNSLCFNLARSIGPGIGGVIVATWGVVPAILANCCAYLAASMTMPLLKLDAATRRGHAPTGSVLREALDGIVYVARHPGMGPLFLYAATVGVLIRAVPELLPPFVAGLFGRGAEGLATVSSAIGLAALAGGTFIAMRGRLKGLCKLAVGSGLVLALATAGFVATHAFPFAVVCAAAMGAATTIHGIAVQTLLQTATASHMIGRVLSLWGMITRAAPAMGALSYGAASEVAGLQAPVLVGCAIAAGACVAAISRLPHMARALERGEAPT
nr:MFS transporter [Limobrevibacterium gyesilva]